MSDHKPFIVTFKSSATQEEIDKYAQQVEQAGGKIKHKYNSAILKGFAATIPEGFMGSLKDEPAVEYIEPDGEVSI